VVSDEKQPACRQAGKQVAISSKLTGISEKSIPAATEILVKAGLDVFVGRGSVLGYTIKQFLQINISLLQLFFLHSTSLRPPDRTGGLRRSKHLHICTFAH
jgi:hypothetical protein